MTERIVFSSINGFIEQAKRHPGLLRIGAFTVFKDIVTKLGSEKSCRCNKSGTDLTAYRPQFEAAMAMLMANDIDKAAVKSLLSVKNICFLARNSKGQINQTCF